MKRSRKIPAVAAALAAVLVGIAALRHEPIAAPPEPTLATEVHEARLTETATGSLVELVPAPRIELYKEIDPPPPAALCLSPLPTTRVHGRVVDSYGFPVARVTMQLQCVDQRRPNLQARTDGYGRFVAPTVRHGTYDVFLDRNLLPRGVRLGREPQVRRLEVAGDAVDAGVFALEQNARLAGRVITAAGAPIALAQVRLQGPGESHQVFTNGFGIWQCGELPPGRYGIEVSLQYAGEAFRGKAAPRLAEFEVPAGSALDLPPIVCGLPGVAVTGTIVDRFDDRPVANLEVRALAARARTVAAFTPATLATVRTAQDGSFCIEGLEPGAVDLVIDPKSGREKSRLAEAPAPITLELQRERRDLGRIAVVLRHPFTVQGKVVLPPDWQNNVPRRRFLSARMFDGERRVGNVHVERDGTFEWQCHAPCAPVRILIANQAGEESASTMVLPRPDSVQRLTFTFPQ